MPGAGSCRPRRARRSASGRRRSTSRARARRAPSRRLSTDRHGAGPAPRASRCGRSPTRPERWRRRRRPTGPVQAGITSTSSAAVLGAARPQRRRRGRRARCPPPGPRGRRRARACRRPSASTPERGLDPAPSVERDGGRTVRDRRGEQVVRRPRARSGAVQQQGDASTRAASSQETGEPAAVSLGHVDHHPVHGAACSRAGRARRPRSTPTASRPRRPSTARPSSATARAAAPVTVTGRLRSVTLRPVANAPAVEADLWDGTGRLTLLFLGRRRIPGITPGRHLVVHGRAIVRDGERTHGQPALRAAARDQRSDPVTDHEPDDGSRDDHALARHRGRDAGEGGTKAPASPATPPPSSSWRNAIGGWRGLVRHPACPSLVFLLAYYVHGQDAAPRRSGRRSSPARSSRCCASCADSRCSRCSRASSASRSAPGSPSRTGKAEDFYLPGLLINVAYGTRLSRSRASSGTRCSGTASARPPATSPAGARVPEQRRALPLATWFFVAVFVLRYSSQVPLYLAGAVEALGTAGLILGWPLFALAAYLSFRVISKPGRTRRCRRRRRLTSAERRSRQRQTIRRSHLAVFAAAPSSSLALVASRPPPLRGPGGAVPASYGA